VSSTLRIGALQLRAHDRAQFSVRLAEINASVRAAAAGLDLLVLPEATFPAYVLGDAAIDDATVNAALESLRQVAKATSCVIVAGAATRNERALFNSAVVFDRDGTVAGRADKLFLWHFDGKWFAPGERLSPIRTSIGMLGVLICADGRMPGIARALVDRGAELLVMPTAWVTSGRDPSALENIQADLLARVRAYENGVPFVAANKCGNERGMVAYCGKSQIIDAAGVALAMAGERDEELITSTIEIAAPKPYRIERPNITPRGAVERTTIRVAFTLDAVPADVDERLALLDADVAVAPGYAQGIAQLDRVLPTIAMDAALARDPGTLIHYRNAGYRCVILTSDAPAPWLEDIARARATELRLYLIVFDRARGRAYAIDPDGAIVAGSFDGYRFPSFALDTKRTLATVLVPGTDVAAGIERVTALARREESA
jgi:predicted amidohydrolase